MIKVCHITSAHGPEDVRIFHKECTSLAKAGYEVYLVQRGKRYEKNGVHITGFGEVTGGRLKRMTQVARRAYEAALTVDADIYHLHDPELLPYGMKLKKHGKKVIFDSHEDTLESIMEKAWIPALARKMVYLWFKDQQEQVCRQLDMVITVTPHMTGFFQSINSQTIQISNFPILEDIPNVPKQENTLIFAGGISRQWNHHALLSAMENLPPEVRYLLYGAAKDDYLSELQSMPAWERTRYFGRVPHEEIFSRLAQAQIGVALVSYSRNTDLKNGTMGNTKIFEEMMMGLPVVCTDFVLWREFVERYHCGLCVNPENPEDIAAAISYLLDNPEEARRMGENGRRAVKEEFNWGVEEKKLLAMYENLTIPGKAAASVRLSSAGKQTTPPPRIVCVILIRIRAPHDLRREAA